MSHFRTNLNFDTDFCVPSDCLREGDVACRVVFSDCEVLHRWDDLLTFRIKLILRLTVSSGELRCSFDREIILKETVWLCPDACITDCKVKAAGCRCVLQRGLVFCSGAVSAEFLFKKPEPFCPCPIDRCHRWEPEPQECFEPQEECAPCRPCRPAHPRYRKRCH